MGVVRARTVHSTHRRRSFTCCVRAKPRRSGPDSASLATARSLEIQLRDYHVPLGDVELLRERQLQVHLLRCGEQDVDPERPSLSGQARDAGGRALWSARSKRLTSGFELF